MKTSIPEATERKESKSAMTASLLFKPSQLKAIRTLVSGESKSQAARVAKVHRSTLDRWLKDPYFLAEYKRSRADAAMGTLRGLINRERELIGAIRDEAMALLNCPAWSETVTEDGTVIVAPVNLDRIEEAVRLMDTATDAEDYLLKAVLAPFIRWIDSGCDVGEVASLLEAAEGLHLRNGEEAKRAPAAQ